MTIAYAALHERLRYRGENTGLYVAAFEDGRMFFSHRQPPLYDQQARPIPVREVLPGSLRQHQIRYRAGLQPDGSCPGGSGTISGVSVRCDSG
jgi:hypothetical protein